MKKNKVYSQNGAISIFVMMAMLFFLIATIGMYMVSSKRAQTQTESVGIISDEYYTEDEEKAAYDNKMADKSEIIPIYTKEQLWTVGTGKSIEIDGKVYKCTANANYELKNDIIINLDEVDKSKFDYDWENLDKKDYEIYYFYDGDYYVSVESGGDKFVTVGDTNYYFSKILADEITAQNYGDPVQYSANGISDWKIFYNDGKNVFIIASDYVPNSLVPAETNMDKLGNYGVYWQYVASLKKVGASDIVDSVANKYMFSWLFKNQTNRNNTTGSLRGVAVLMDTAAWDPFVDTNVASSAIGGPTLEMFVDSWNQKGYEKLYCDKTDLVGYYIGTVSNPTTKMIDISSTQGFSDELYFVKNETAVTNGCYGYWLSSPSAVENTARCICKVSYDGYLSRDDTDHQYGYGYTAVRPIVCLKSTVVGEKVNAIWNIK